MNTIMDLAELNHYIGQLFMIGMPGRKLDKKTRALIRDYNIGGIILFKRNIADPLQLARLCNDIKAASMKYHGNSIFIAIDQEGGRVARLKPPFTQFAGNEAIGLDNDPENKARIFAEVTAREMNLVGLNMDLAPVMDVKTGVPDKHLEGRIFSDDASMVSLLGGIIIETLQQNGVMAVAKHFPGLGQAKFDPHHNQVIIDLDGSDIEKINFPPFVSAIGKNVSGIMTSHAIYAYLDPEYPATLSSAILIGILRDKFKYNGLILADDLEMGAVKKKWGVSAGALASFKAGVDILLVCKNQEYVLESIDLIRKNILTDEIPFTRLYESIKRISNAKSGFISNSDISTADIKDYFNL